MNEFEFLVNYLKQLEKPENDIVKKQSCYIDNDRKHMIYLNNNNEIIIKDFGPYEIYSKTYVLDNNKLIIKNEIAQNFLKELDYDKYLLNEKLKEELLINNTTKKVVKI